MSVAAYRDVTFFLIVPRPLIPTRTDTLLPYPTLFRSTLAEKSLDCELRTEKVCVRREVFLRLNPAGRVPVFVDEDGTSIPGSSVIAEYLERSEEHTSELQSLMRISYAVFCLKKKTSNNARK